MTVHSLSIYDRLISAGLPDRAVREHATIVEELVDQQLVTKRDLRELELRLKLYIGGMAAAIVGVLSAVRYFD